MDKSLTVMVVEDEPALLQIITKRLTERGIISIPYKSGVDALKYINTTNVYPDIIWLDYLLPDMNGIAFMEKMKANAQAAKIPVVVVSNSASDTHVNSMMALGAKKYILKAENRLDDIIDTLLV